MNVEYITSCVNESCHTKSRLHCLMNEVTLPYNDETTSQTGHPYYSRKMIQCDKEAFNQVEKMSIRAKNWNALNASQYLGKVENFD